MALGSATCDCTIDRDILSGNVSGSLKAQDQRGIRNVPRRVHLLYRVLLSTGFA